MDLTGQFLIAMPSLEDPRFQKTVTYICSHNKEGAMGLVINKPLQLGLKAMLSQLSIETNNTSLTEQKVFYGGPVHSDRGFVLHRPNSRWESTITVCQDVGVSTSRDILKAISLGTGPTENLVALGYAGWEAGQLEAEISANAWLNGPADLAVAFRAPIEERWTFAALHLGINFAKMSTDIGHA
jgi:putative transcriptional regulator